MPYSLNDIKDETVKMMQLILADFFDIRMNSLYGKSYMREVLVYCNCKQNDGSINQDQKAQKTIIRDKIKAVGIEVVSAKEHFDISMLYHLIAYGFQSDFDSLFSDENINIRTFHDLMRNIGTARNKIMHDMSIERDPLPIISSTIDAISDSEALLNFLEKTGNLDLSTKSTYIAEMRGEVARIEEMLLPYRSAYKQPQHNQQASIRPNNPPLHEANSIFDDLYLTLCACRKAFRLGNQININQESSALGKLMQQVFELSERNRYINVRVAQSADDIVTQYNMYVEKYNEFVQELSSGSESRANVCAQYAEEAFSILMDLVLRAQSRYISPEDTQ